MQQSRRGACRVTGAPLLLAVVFLPAGANARALAGSSTTSSTVSVTQEELEAIQRALGADQAASEEESQEAAPSLPPAVQSLLPDLSVTLDVAAAAFSRREPLQTGGHDPVENGFTLQQLELALASMVDPYFRFDANLVFSSFGVEIEEAYATTLALPGLLQLRAGQFLTRFGRINPTHLHSWDFVDQPFAIGRVFGGEGNRGAGAELSVLAPLPWFVELSGAATMARGEGTARSFFGAEDLGVESPLDLQYTAALKQFFPLGDDLSLSFGVSAATGPNPTGRSNRTDVYGVDVYLKYRPITRASTLVLSLQSEWLYRRRQIPSALLQDATGYVQAFLRFARRWETAVRWELGTPVKGALDPLDPEWTENRQRTTASLTFRPTEFSRIRAQGGVDAPAWLDAPIWSAMLAIEITAGSHAAHPF